MAKRKLLKEEKKTEKGEREKGNEGKDEGMKG